jgi:HEAT repeat protein
VIASTRSGLRNERERLAHVESLRDGGAKALPALLAELVEPSWAVRRAVVALLAEEDLETASLLCAALRTARDNESKLAGIVDALSASIRDVDDQLIALTAQPLTAVVCDAVQVLGRRESARAVPVLAALTAHADDNVALAAVEALGRIGGKAAVDSLLKLVEGGNFFRTFPAIDVLGRSRDVRVLDALVRLAQDALYAPEAVRALGRLGDPAAAPHLVRLLERAGESLVRTIAVALAAIHEQSRRRFGTGAALERGLLGAPNLSALRAKLVASVARADPTEQIALGQVLVWIGEESTVPALLALLDGPGAVAQVAAASLRKLASIAEPQLIEALREGSAAHRRLVIPILSGRDSAQEELVRCLDDDDPAVRASACDALAQVSDPTVSRALFRLLGDADGRVAQAALGALQSLGSDEVKRLSLAASGSGDERVRSAALRIISYFSYPEGLEILMGAASAAEERVRDAAVNGLATYDDPRATEMLVQAVQHASIRTRTSAVRALGHTTGGAAVAHELRTALEDQNPWVRYYACQSLGKLADAGATELVAARLADESGQVRVAAVEALAHLPGTHAFEVLLETAGSDDPDLHRAALVALGSSKRREALPCLLAAVTELQPATRLVALSALAELGLLEAVPAIARATNDRDEGVRVAAAGFLAARSDASTTRELIDLLKRTPARESLVHALARPAAGRVEAIASALAAADDAVAGALVGSLARMNVPEATGAIRAGLEAHNDAVRRASASALVAMQDPASASALERAALVDPDAEVRRICAASLPR